MLRPQVYWHLWHPNGSNIGQLLLAEQALTLEESGLAAAADVHLTVVGDALCMADPYTERPDANYPRGPGFGADYPWLTVSVVGPEERNLYEGVTLQKLWQHAQQVDPATPFLYFHGKGASNMTRCRNRWRRLLEYFCITRWRTAVAALETYDTYGALWYPKHTRHYSGNFWWARAGYLAQLPDPTISSRMRSGLRFQYEAWIGLKNPSHFNAYDDLSDHYTVPLPPPSVYEAYMPVDLPAAHFQQQPMKRYDIINHLIALHNYHTYLEIGTEYRDCFDRIQCPRKVCVDATPRPGITYNFTMSSDEFFAQNTEKFDLVFIDGNHAAEYVERDVLNALACLNPGGRIVLHDCSPPDAAHHSYKLCGTVWKALYKLRTTRTDLVLHTVDTDYGVGILRRSFGVEPLLPDANPFYDREIFERDRHAVLNLITPTEFMTQAQAAGQLR